MIAGTLRILHQGREIDGYKIEVRLAVDHPKNLPMVYEIGGRIPRMPSHHINPDGSLCLGVPEDLHIRGGAYNVVRFLDGPVRSFLLGHSYFVQERRWPGGEWDHGDVGIRQFYTTITGTAAPRVASILVAAALAPVDAIDFDARCVCDGPLSVRVCHGPVIQLLRYFVPPTVLVRAQAALSPSPANRRRSDG